MQSDEIVDPPGAIVSCEDAVSPHALEDDPDLQVRCLLPDTMNFDFAVNTMVYQPGASLSMVEMHVMEHGLLMLEGGGIYRLGDSWYPDDKVEDVSKAISHLQELEPPSLDQRGAMRLEVDRHRLSAEIEELATISDAEAPAVTRVVFTPTDLKARAWVRERCEEAGLVVRRNDRRLCPFKCHPLDANEVGVKRL